MNNDCETNLILDIQNLHVEYRTMEGTVYTLNGLDLHLDKGKTLGIVGETGAGKTTTGLAILKLIPNPPGVITEGDIFLNGKSVINTSEKEMEKIRGRQVSMIFQDPMTSLDPVVTVAEQIAEVIELHEKCGHNQAIEKALDMLELVGIKRDRGNEYPHQFSGGMKQRVVIAIALACNPELLIADEPTTALDVTIQAQVLELMKELKEKYNTSMLMITHDLGIIAEICDTVSVVYAGRVVEYGTLEDIFDHASHPYTKGLFDSLPDMDSHKKALKPIPGLMPDPTNLPKGCSFCTRCVYATDTCHELKPQRYNLGGEHYVECHLFSAKNAKESEMISNG